MLFCSFKQCAYLSFKSDYLRTRWGRRIPFFAGSLPFVCMSVLPLAYSDNIANSLHRSGWMFSFSPTMVSIIVLGTCVVAFQFSDVLIASVFQYIFNDTVPVTLIGRFIGLMQVVGGTVGFLYNYFIFKYAESHMKEIFVCTSILYGAGIGMLCFFVKEGEYAPISDQERLNARGIAGFKTFFRESFSHKFYWTKFLYAITPGLAWSALSPFNIFFYKEMGLTLDYVGKAVAVVSVAGIIAAYFSSIFIDRWHPLRIITYSAVFSIVFSISSWVWLFVTLPPVAFFWLQMLGAGMIGTFHSTLTALAGMPCDIRLQPKSRYGQFCSAQSILTNGSNVLAGLSVGIFFDFLKWIFRGSDYAYRFNFIWSCFWLMVGTIIVCNLYRQWKALGGDLHFHPPASWTETGYEEMEKAPFVGTQVLWLNRALSLVHLLILGSILYLLPLLYWLYRIGWSVDFFWHLAVILPIAVVLYAAWIKVECAIKADVNRRLSGTMPRNGIPHHGVFFIKACALLLLLVVGIGKTIMAVQGGLKTGVIVFSAANLITNFLVIMAVLVLCRLERGEDPMLNYDSRHEFAKVRLT